MTATPRRRMVLYAIAGALIFAGLYLAGSGEATTASAGPNMMIGTAGPDRLVGTAGTDFIAGRGGDDYLNGRRGHDSIRGGYGADRIIGGPGSDDLAGGPGNDEINAQDGRLDGVQCGRGRHDFAQIDIGLDVVDESCEHVGGVG